MLPLLALDPSLLNLKDEERDFFKAITGIKDDEELREHILAVQKEAYAVFPYSSIRSFTFTRMTISRLPGYREVLTLAKEMANPILLDVGCCFGVDIRKAIHDGWPADQVVATDIVPEFWDLGHKLFRSSASTFPVPFLAGDIFDSDILTTIPPAYDAPTAAPPDFATLHSLNPLHHRVTAIHASAIFHLFPQDRQLALAHALAALLSPAPGSTIFGWSTGKDEAGFVEFEGGVSHPRQYCHSPESWAQLWNGGVFETGTVEVVAMNREFEEVIGLKLKGDAVLKKMEWAVRRL
ncbi:hypothetical protein BV25DRAFT_1828338 [Artomyces pyxidatus]|uniref:Uncharacterized protein n=1 Tax=Artomyces pyxidatus TaxID=48021 RepID=A0ACB8SUP3_9AGAM|nr:hypothetical protein BV25DRAFT_1828338 [Artomyces pyxidatus]